MTKVRECSEEDLPFLYDLAIKFNARHYDVPLNTEKLEKYLLDMLWSDKGVLLRNEHSAIVGVEVDDPLRNWRVLVETAWFSERSGGIALLRAFEQEGRRRNVDEVRMTTLEVNPGVARILSYRGYSPIETSHRLLI